MLMYLTTDSKASGSDSQKAMANAVMVRRYTLYAPTDPLEYVWLKNDTKPWSTWIDIDESSNKRSCHLVFVVNSQKQTYTIEKTRMEATNPGVVKVISLGADVGLTGPDMVKWIKESMAPTGLAVALPLPEGLEP